MNITSSAVRTSHEFVGIKINENNCLLFNSFPFISSVRLDGCEGGNVPSAPLITLVRISDCQ